MYNNLPTEYQPFLAELAAAPENIRAIWRYAIVLLMIDDEKARVMGTRVHDGHELIAIRTLMGDDFEVERPVMSGETEKVPLEQIRDIMAEEDSA